MTVFAQGSGLRLLIASLAVLIALQTLIFAVSHYARTKGKGAPANPYVMQQIAAVADHLNELALDRRDGALAAVNSPFVRYRLLDGPPENDLYGERLPAYRPLVRAYGRILGDRPFEVYRRRVRTVLPVAGDRFSRFVRYDLVIVVPLADGAALVVEPDPDYRRQGLIILVALLSSVLGLFLLAGLVWASIATTRPIRRLSAAAYALSKDLDAPAIDESGPEPVRQLAAAFNQMQREIKSLIDQRALALAAVAHDFRTYLTRLRMRAEFIGDDAQRQKAERDIEEMTTLIDDALTFVKGETEPSVKERFDLAALVADIAASQRELGGSVAFAAPDGPVPVDGAALQVRRAIANIVENALRYGGSADIALHLADGRTRLSVRDGGDPVEAEALSKLTEPFYRGEASRSRATGGAGLGLAITKSLIEKNAGVLTIAPGEPGGLVVSVSFPLAA
ncbi:MAG: ATP-binding protein [Pseudomonadota bacterium]